MTMNTQRKNDGDECLKHVMDMGCTYEEACQALGAAFDIVEALHIGWLPHYPREKRLRMLAAVAYTLLHGTNAVIGEKRGSDVTE